MKLKIKDLNYLKQDNAASEAVFSMDTNEVKNIMKGIANRDKITADTLFSVVDYFELDCNLNYNYFLLENEYGMFVIREDNVIEVPEIEDAMDNLGIKKIFKSDNKTIMISYDDKKTVITRSKEDEDDNLKAVMIALLKREGYPINDIFEVANSLLPEKKEKTSNNIVITELVTVNKENKSRSKKATV